MPVLYRLTGWFSNRTGNARYVAAKALVLSLKFVWCHGHHVNTHASDATIITLLHSIIHVRYRYTSTLLNGKLFHSPGRPGIYLPRKVKVELDLSLLRDKFSLGYEWSGAWLYTRITVSMYLYRWKQTSYNSRANYSLACLSSETHNVQHIFHPGGGGTPLYRLYRYVRRQRVCFCSRFGLK